MGTTQNELLRLYAADPTTDAEGLEIRPFFNETQITDLLTRFDDDLYGAAAEAWRIKAAWAVELVNSDTDNSRFDLSDIHKHAMMMADHYSSISGTEGGVELTNIRMSTETDEPGEGDDFTG